MCFGCIVNNDVLYIAYQFDPFYGEDFYCEIPRSFRHLSFYIFDRDVFRRDSSIGKVAVKKEDLQKYHGKDHWFPLQPVCADSEVQGMVHLELRLSEVITDSGVVCHKLATRVLECQDLPIVNNQCDPYAAVSLLGSSRSFFFSQVTKPLSYTKRQFDVEEDDVDKLALKVDLWNASNLKFGDEFLGEVRVPLKVLGQSGVHDAWYFLQPRDNGYKSVKADELGSLRLNIVYTEDHVFPTEHYNPLRDLLLQSAHIEPVSASAAHILGEVCREKQEAAVPLVRLFLHYGKIVPFLSAIAHAEISRTYKCSICTDHKPCEIDPVKLKESENLDTNRENLRQYVDRIFNVITSSGVSCPTVMGDIFFSLRESAASRFEVDPDVRYTAVSSFIFLRFFAPAILSPNLFQLRPHHPDPYTSRTLTLISKTIQTLGSLAKSKSANFKESYMAAFYDYFNEQKYADAVKNFLDLISSSARWDQKSIETPIMLKEGFMIKRAQGRNRFGLKNFKKRWFRLTNHEFTYHKTKGEGALCSIPIENILAVERLEEESFKMKNMFQVIQPERALYIQANNCVEARDWIDILTKVSQCNRKRLSTYHPSAFLNGHWLCCKLSADSAPGCTPCTGGLPANIQLDVDGDRETERIYSLYSTYMAKLVKMQVRCISVSHLSIQRPVAVSLCTTVLSRKYKRDKFRKTKYGSQEHPIGDQSFQCYIRQQSESSTYSI
uniref:Ras GTPase-activating protein 3-like n=1 Tax=Sinocyclocheilus anshuiensis TaxID=1608454 RepID=A0A671PMF6_9TELE